MFADLDPYRLATSSQGHHWQVEPRELGHAIRGPRMFTLEDHQDVLRGWGWRLVTLSALAGRGEEEIDLAEPRPVGISELPPDPSEGLRPELTTHCGLEPSAEGLHSPRARPRDALWPLGCQASGPGEVMDLTGQVRGPWLDREDFAPLRSALRTVWCTGG